MAAKKTAKKAAKKAASSKTTAKATHTIDQAVKVTGLSKARIKEIDEKCKKSGDRPLSFLASMLGKQRKNIQKLEVEVTKRMNKK